MPGIHRDAHDGAESLPDAVHVIRG
jgi:hypothetical protein